MNIGIYCTKDSRETALQFLKNRIIKHLSWYEIKDFENIARDYCVEVKSCFGLINFYLIDIGWTMSFHHSPLSIDYSIITDDIRNDRIMMKYVINNTIGRYSCISDEVANEP